jgi:hypothetical protein
MVAPGKRRVAYDPARIPKLEAEIKKAADLHKKIAEQIRRLGHADRLVKQQMTVTPKRPKSR